MPSASATSSTRRWSPTCCASGTPRASRSTHRCRSSTTATKGTSAKHERNLPLLLEHVRHEPHRVYLWWHLGTVHAVLGQMNQARAAFEHGLQIVREDGLKPANDIVVYCEVAFRPALDGRPVDDLVAEGLGLDPGCQPLRAAALMAARREGRWERVEGLADVLLSALDRAPATAS